ncbi:MAG: hypothetical protein LBC37_00350 [Zoogloeaceae bacterium]|nr:hypothetical protein [Zoogloeaceae bacterium]
MCFFIMALVASPLSQATPPDWDGPFTPDAKVAARAKYHAGVLVRTVRELYGIKLDYSDASIEKLEQLLNEIDAKDGFDKPEQIVRRIDAQSTRPVEELPGFADFQWSPRSRTPQPTRQTGQPSMNFCDAAGGYIGETLRRNHDAEWGTITHMKRQTRSVAFSAKGVSCAPYAIVWSKCKNFPPEEKARRGNPWPHAIRKNCLQAKE